MKLQNYGEDLRAIDSNPNQPSERRKFVGIVFGDANYYLKYANDIS